MKAIEKLVTTFVGDILRMCGRAVDGRPVRAKRPGRRRGREVLASIEQAVLKVVRKAGPIDAKGIASKMRLRPADIRAPLQALCRGGKIRASGRKQGTKYTVPTV